MEPLYPALLKLSGKPVLVVGGGPVAARKVRRLHAAGARITLVAPTAVDELAELAAEGALRWERRPFDPADVAGATLIFSATGVEEVDRAVVEAAGERSVWVNVADAPAGGDLQLPAVVTRGPLLLTASTAGAAPGYAARLVRALAEELPTGVGEYVELLGELRSDLRRRFPDDRESRRRAFAAALDCGAALEELARSGPEAARRMLWEAAAQAADTHPVDATPENNDH